METLEKKREDQTTQTFTDKVIHASADNAPPRARVLMSSLIRHLHHFAVETDLTLDELVHACDFMVRAGKISNGGRNEFNLIANVLGLEVLVDMISPYSGQTTVLGPMYLPHAPELKPGQSIVQQSPTDGRTALIEGYVHDAHGHSVGNVTIEVWQASTNGLYDVEDAEQPSMNLRGTFHTDETGYYSLRCLRPTPYPIPTDGPGGELLKLFERHPMRAAHVHFRITAPGKHSLVAQLYDANCPYIGDDSIFAVKNILTLNFEPSDGRTDADYYVRYDWTMLDEQR
jgi:catechol 1,2-dioxygenase